MIDYHKELVSALNNVLPTYYELALTKDTKVPCISYQERNNYAEQEGDTLGYSRISFTIKVWGRFTDTEAIQKAVVAIDAVLRPLGFKRTSTNELYKAPLLQKIMTYECRALEDFNGGI
jgi:hypothetical protein